jgi:mono/diheme cytochrome c family protein
MARSPDFLDNSWLRPYSQLLLAIFVCLAALCFTSCTSSSSAPRRRLTVEEQHGREVYETSCAVCHNAYKKEPLQGPALVGMFRKKALPSGMPTTDEHVRDTILTGRRNMPPFNVLLDDKQLNDLMAFLHTL